MPKFRRVVGSTREDLHAPSTKSHHDASLLLNLSPKGAAHRSIFLDACGQQISATILLSVHSSLTAPVYSYDDGLLQEAAEGQHHVPLYHTKKKHALRSVYQNVPVERQPQVNRPLAGREKGQRCAPPTHS